MKEARLYIITDDCKQLIGLVEDLDFKGVTLCDNPPEVKVEAPLSLRTQTERRYFYVPTPKREIKPETWQGRGKRRKPVIGRLS